MKTIGILGGMGSYATCNLFHRLLDAFPAEKEWQRPRILIDNNCTMPSRVRAILYGEKQEQLVSEMSESIESLVASGAEYILIGCMTAHFFRDRLPHQDKIIDGLEITRRWMEQNYKEGTTIYCLCTEGSIRTGIWTEALSSYNIVYPEQEDMKRLRAFIESVKQNLITDEVCCDFVRYIEKSPHAHILLGCTELPILLRNIETNKLVIDPIYCMIQYLKELIGA